MDPLTAQTLNSYQVDLKRRYGARGNDSADDSTKLQDALQDCTDRGGGTIVCPPGRYLIDGAFARYTGGLSTSAMGQVVFPVRNLTTQSPVMIRLVGTVPPPLMVNWVSGETPPLHQIGAIFISPKTSVGNEAYGMFSGAGPDAAAGAGGSQWKHAAVHAWFENLTFRLTANPSMTALNLRHVGAATVKNCMFDTGTAYGSLTEPNAQGFALRMPRTDNWAVINADNIDVIGFHQGISWAEHFDGDRLRAWKCVHPFRPTNTNHTWRVGRSMVVACINGIVPESDSGLSSTCKAIWEEYGTEHETSGWYASATDISDATNILRLRLRYGTVVSNVGDSSEFRVTGGAGCYIDDLKSDPYVQSVPSATFDMVGVANDAWTNVTGFTLALPHTGVWEIGGEVLTALFATGSTAGVYSDLKARWFNTTDNAAVSGSITTLLNATQALNATHVRQTSLCRQVLRINGPKTLTLQVASKYGTYASSSQRVIYGADDPDGRRSVLWARRVF